jgi:ankyrin repeat protein
MNAGWHNAQAAAPLDVETVRHLFEQTPDLIHTYSSDGWTYLHRAARLGSVDVALLLLGYGAEVNARAHNELANTPILCAVIGAHIDLVKLLLARGADVNLANSAGATPLHKAAITGNCAVLRLLLAHQAQVDARNSGGQTPLVHAQFLGHAEAVALLEQQVLAPAV